MSRIFNISKNIFIFFSLIALIACGEKSTGGEEAPEITDKDSEIKNNCVLVQPDLYYCGESSEPVEVPFSASGSYFDAFSDGDLKIQIFFNEELDPEATTSMTIELVANEVYLDDVQYYISSSDPAWLEIKVPKNSPSYGKMQVEVSGVKSVSGDVAERFEAEYDLYTNMEPLAKPKGRGLYYRVGPNGTVYANTRPDVIGDDEAGFFVSKNGGKSFELVKKLSDDYDVHLHPVTPGTLALTKTTGDVYQAILSFDYGQTWRPIQGLPERFWGFEWNLYAESISISASKGTLEYDYIEEVFLDTIAPEIGKSEVSPKSPYAYRSSQYDSNTPGVMISSDGGRTFTLQPSTGLPIERSYTVIAANSSDPSSVFAGVQRNYIETYHSDDFGNSFSAEEKGPLSRSPAIGGVRRIFQGDRAVLYSLDRSQDDPCSSGGNAYYLYSSLDGRNWNSSDKICVGYSHGYLNSVTSEYVFIGSGENLYRFKTPPLTKAFLGRL